MIIPTRNQKGFTLVEIAIVLVIIGLLLGGILKGQELINSARVRNLADMNSGIQAAYYGFIDRYRAVPGDMTAAAATQAIGQAITGGPTVSNGRINHAGTGVTSVYQEPNALWEHLSKAGFIQGSYSGDTSTAPDGTGTHAPLNVFNGDVMVGRTSDYMGATNDRLHLVLGANIPVNIMRELDVKVDDGAPYTGVLRRTIETGGAGATLGAGAESDTGCVDTTTPGSEFWDISGDVQGCNAVFLY